MNFYLFWVHYTTTTRLTSFYDCLHIRCDPGAASVVRSELLRV